jgi:outer membrane protein
MIFVTTMITFCFFVASSYGADVAKIGVVDLQRILDTSSVGKTAKAEISKRGEKMEADLKRKGEAIEELRKKLEREALVMSKEMRVEKEREVRININDFKSLQKKYMADFKQYEKGLVSRIQKEVLEIVAKIGKKEGFLLILEKREGGVMYSPNTIDITDKLIQQYNAGFAKKAE